jgi:hypothetical protein
MATIEIPLDSSVPDFRQTVQLDEIPYVLEFDYCEQDLSWYFSLYRQTDGDPVPVLEGYRVSVRYPILLGVCGEDRPPGELIFLDLNGTGDPQRGGLGTTTKLYYQEA